MALIAGSQIETVEFLLNNQSLGFKNTPPFVMNFTTPEQMGRQTLTIKVTNNNGIVSERSIPITVARERFSEVDTPSISEVDKNFRTLSVTTRLPNFADIEEAQIRVSQPNQILYEETWAPPNKFKYIFVPTSGLRGTVDVELFTKLRGEADFRQVDSQIVRY